MKWKGAVFTKQRLGHDKDLYLKFSSQSRSMLMHRMFDLAVDPRYNCYIQEPGSELWMYFRLSGPYTIDKRKLRAKPKGLDDGRRNEKGRGEENFGSNAGNPAGNRRNSDGLRTTDPKIVDVADSGVGRTS